MGHKGDIEHRYTLNRHKLAPDLIEKMRDSYRRSQKYRRVPAVYDACLVRRRHFVKN